MNHNINDPRVRRRIQAAFAFSIAWLGVGGRPVSNRQINSAFGQNQLPLAQMLRKRLLICTNSRYNKDTGRTKRWAYNTDGIIEIAQLLGYPEFRYNPNSKIGFNQQLELFYRSYAVEYLNDKFKDQLSTGEFEYRDSSNRLWSPIQNLRREVRTEIMMMNGYHYQYDIESCAPTLLYQLWQRNNRFTGGLVELPRIVELLQDRTAVRLQVSAQTGIPVDQVKTAITSLFNGARLVSNDYCALYAELDEDDRLIEALKGNQWIAGLMTDVRNLWTGIAHGMPEVRTWDNSTKWQIYFQKERLVVDEMEKFFHESGARTFRIHDCLVSDMKVDVDQVSDHIWSNTGYQTNIEYKQYSLANASQEFTNATALVSLT